jgi:Fe-S-cluster containining protein
VNPDANAIAQVRRIFTEVEEKMKLPLLAGAAQMQVKEPSCHKCTAAACCRQAIYVTLFEVFPLARHLVETGRDTPELRARLRDAGYRMETTPNAGWLDRYEACVFLENERCTVYEHRPVRCRSYWVFSPAEQCGPPSGRDVAFANYTGATTVALQFGRRLHKDLRLKETRMRILMATLPRATLIVLEAMDADVSFEQFVRSSVWPSETNLAEWLDYQPPAASLVKLKKWKDGPPTR